ncbi:MAG: hypothetical protein LBP42_01115 [Treponema sp.]|jgi:hypothetical protein|nr:hypothetical protein [Treponema sp.]
MNRRFQSHPFWGIQAPLSSLVGGCLLVTASNCLAFALVVCGALLWVYGLSVLGLRFLSPWFPQRGEKLILIFFTALLGNIYLLLLFLISPLLAMGTSLWILLIPPCCFGSGVLSRFSALDPAEALIRALLEALALGGLIIALALIREPLGFAALSLPGREGGIIEVFSAEKEGFFPVRIISVSAGAFLLLGYGVALFRHIGSQYVRFRESP